jgi:hypothetical protein
MRGIELGRRPGGRNVDETIRSLVIEPNYPVPRRTARPLQRKIRTEPPLMDSGWRPGDLTWTPEAGAERYARDGSIAVASTSMRYEGLARRVICSRVEAGSALLLGKKDARTSR